MFSASPPCLLARIISGLHLDGAEGVFDPSTAEQGSFAPGLVGKRCFAPHTERRSGQRAQTTPQEGDAPRGLKGTPLSLLPTLLSRSAPACFPERKPATLLLFFFFLIFFSFFVCFLFSFFSQCEQRGPAGGQPGAGGAVREVPAGRGGTKPAAACGARGRIV